MTSRLGGTLSLDGDVGQQFTLSLGALKTAAVASEEVSSDAQQEALKFITDSAGESLIIALSSSKKWAAFIAYCQQEAQRRVTETTRKHACRRFIQQLETLSTEQFKLADGATRILETEMRQFASYAASQGEESKAHRDFEGLAEMVQETLDKLRFVLITELACYFLELLQMPSDAPHEKKKAGAQTMQEWASRAIRICESATMLPLLKVECPSVRQLMGRVEVVAAVKKQKAVLDTLKVCDKFYCAALGTAIASSAVATRSAGYIEACIRAVAQAGEVMKQVPADFAGQLEESLAAFKKQYDVQSDVASQYDAKFSDFVKSLDGVFESFLKEEPGPEADKQMASRIRDIKDRCHTLMQHLAFLEADADKARKFELGMALADAFTSSALSKTLCVLDLDSSLPQDFVDAFLKPENSDLVKAWSKLAQNLAGDARPLVASLLPSASEAAVAEFCELVMRCNSKAQLSSLSVRIAACRLYTVY